MTKVKIIVLYLLSLLFISTFFFLRNSDYLSSIIKKADNFRIHNGFFLFLITGLIEYGLLVTGVLMILVLTYFLVQKNAT